MELLRGTAPELIYNLIKHQSSRYKGRQPGTFATVTELIRPAYEVALKRRFDNLIKTNAMDLLHATTGTILHAALAEANGQVGMNRLQEERLEVTVEDKKITGAFDDFSMESTGLGEQKGLLTDFKYTSCWSYVYKSTMQNSWVPQLNLYAHLLRAHDFQVDRLQVLAYFRDWSENKAMDPSYPPQKAMEIPIFMWSRSETIDYLYTRVWALKKALREVEIHDVASTPCTPEERWDRPTVYAVMKSGAKRSIKNCETEAEAEKKITQLMADPKNKALYTIQNRPGERIKCLRYCAVRDICPENQVYKATLGGDTESTED